MNLIGKLRKNDLAWRALLGFLGVAAFIAFWEWGLEPLARLIEGSSVLSIPTFSESLNALLGSFSDTGGLWNPKLMGDHLALSLGRVLGGFLLAVAIAAPIGLMIGYSKSVEYFLFPINELARPIPPLAWIPVVILLFSGELKIIAICFLGAYFPILINTMRGVRAIDPVLIDASKTLGANRVTTFFKVIIPGASGYMMTGIRVGLGISWMTIVAAEMVSGDGGVGWYIWVSINQTTRFDFAMGGMMLIAIVGYLLFLLMDLIERRFNKWLGTS